MYFIINIPVYTVIILLIKLNITETKNVKDKGGIVGNSVAHAYVCENKQIVLTYETWLPPGEENQYSVNLLEKLIRFSEILVKFDSTASVTLADPTKARVSVISNEIFSIRFFADSDGVRFTVKGPATGTVPYVTSFLVNSVEYCKHPNIGILDKYIEGYVPSAETSLTVPDDTCGRRKVSHTELITSGLNTKPGDWPWHVALYRWQGDTIKYICGGTLVSKSMVITAGHCVTNRGVQYLPEVLSVVLGKFNLIGGDTDSQEREIFKIKVHEHFDYSKLNNDIAILKLKTEVQFNDYIRPACLWSSQDQKKLPDGQNLGTVVGWGFDQTRTLSSTLKQATIPMRSEATCLKSNPIFFKDVLNKYKFCAGYRNGTSPCNGDSGGGFMVFVPDISGDPSPRASGTWHLRGITSLAVSKRNEALCDPHEYVLFTDVFRYVGWLRDNMK